MIGKDSQMVLIFPHPISQFHHWGWGGGSGKKNPNNPNRNREETPTVEVRALLVERNSPMSVTSDSLRLHDAMAEAASGRQHGGSFSENRLRGGSAMLHPGCLIIPHLPP